LYPAALRCIFPAKRGSQAKFEEEDANMPKTKSSKTKKGKKLQGKPMPAVKNLAMDGYIRG
jgi:hypothetical protein